MKLEIDGKELLEPFMENQERMMRKIDALERVILQLMTVSRQKMVWKISDLVPIIGSSREQLRTKDIWKLPRFGESAYPTGPTRWPVDEVIDWLSRSDEEKRAAYQEHVRECFRAEARKRRKAAN